MNPPKIRILLMDLSEATRKVVRHLLERTSANWDIRESSRALENPQNGLEEDWDCILCGHALEGLSGLQWLSRISPPGAQGAQPVVYLASRSGEECTEALRTGAWDALDKGALRSADLELAVRRCADYAALRRQARWQSVELRRSNEELTRFTYVVSHDLKEPLRKIEAFGELLAEGLQEKLDEENAMYLERMRDGARRLGSMLDALLSYARVSARPVVDQWVQLGDVVSEVVESLEARVRECEACISWGPLPEVRGEPILLLQLVQNLLANSLKFRRPQIPPQIHIEALSTDAGHWEITFSDNGLGFPPQHAERIFELFQRLHGGTAGVEGSGVGLATCRKIAENLGGALGARSNPGEGAVFILELPDATVRSVAPPETPKSPS